MKKRKVLTGTILTIALLGANAITAFAGWQNTSQGWKYQWDDGSYCTDGWVLYKDHWYYFGDDQVMETGWIRVGDEWYFAADTGELQSGLMKIDGQVYYFDGNDCNLVTGQRYINDILYNFTEYGVEGDAPYVYNEWNGSGQLIRGEKFGPTKA